MIEISKEKFEQFAKDFFPGKKYSYGKGYFFIQAGTGLGSDLHYEYCKDKMQLHIEIKDRNWREIRNFLKRELKGKSGVSSSYMGSRSACIWTLQDTDLSDWEGVKESFKRMDDFMTPYIGKFESQLNEQKKSETEFNNSNPSIIAQFRTVKECFEKNLKIPNYQRPYRWTEKNVEQLLEDINNCKNEGNPNYLVGSVILHKDGEEYNIVDGQQRVTTLLLLIKAGGGDIPEIIKSIKFNHRDSFYHIRENYGFIGRWLNDNILDKEEFLKYVLDGCQFVEIIVSEYHEAFQMFESQNGRGKELEAYNLLKAYHIRAMSDSPDEDKKECDRRWEYAATYDGSIDLLRQVINEHLYRSRLWSRGEDAYQFSKKHIDEFKGFTYSLEKDVDYVYQNSIIQSEIANAFMMIAKKSNFHIKSRLSHGDPDNMNPFVNINQLILNGKSFFEYVETYVETYKCLFLSTESLCLGKFRDFYFKHCVRYKGARRSGDTYIREVYKSAIMMLFDKFGEDGVNKFYKDIYICLYQYRIRKKSVRYSAMAKWENSSKIFKTIEYSKNLLELYSIKKDAQRYRIEFSDTSKNNNWFNVDEEVISVFRA